MSTSGYTEAERLALLWKKQNALEEKRVEGNFNFNRRDQRARDSFEPRDSKNPKPASVDNEEVDEFGRIRPKSTNLKNEKYRRSHDRSHPGRYTPRSRSRSREKASSRSSNRERSRSREGSRYYNHREKEGRREEDSWSHDLFNDNTEENEREKQKRSLPSDYRPPSPEWISRAGGVAIMRKKSTKEYQS